MNWCQILCLLPLIGIISLFEDIPISRADNPSCIERVSVASSGMQTDGDSRYPVVSADGRYVAFYSEANNLVLGDTNNCGDIFIRDRQTGQTERVSVATNGTQGNSSSEYPAISADGRYVAFQSQASNLVPGDTNGRMDVFIRDRQTGQTERVSVATDGTEGNGDSEHPVLSADGRYVAFQSSATNLVSSNSSFFGENIFVRDRQTSQTKCMSMTTSGVRADGDSWDPAISADGRYVTFSSEATNLVSGDTNGWKDVFVRDQTCHPRSIYLPFVRGPEWSFPPIILPPLILPTPLISP